jgi:hypothetical protein
VYDVQPDHGVIYGVAGTGPSILAANEHFANTGSSQGTNSPSGSNVAYSLPTLVVHGTSGDNLGALINHAANDQYGHGAIIGGPTNTWALAYPASTVDNFMIGTGGAVADQLLQGTANFVQVPAGTLNQSLNTANNLVNAVFPEEYQQQLVLLQPELGLLEIPASLSVYLRSLAADEGLAANPFAGKTPQEIENMLLNRGFDPRGPDPVNGMGGYVNPANDRSYHIDPANSFGEPPHVDVNRLPKNTPELPKKKFPIEG